MKKLKPFVHVTWSQWLLGIDFDWGFRVFIGPIELVW